MIVRNEERKLDECLRMARGFADEIILVDTGSSDKTLRIAEKHGVSIHHFEWIDDFAAARNESLRHAHGKWIIWLDADDRLYPDQHEKIKQLAADNPDRAYNFLLKNDGFENSQCYQLRMFPNRPDIRFERPVHEQIATSIARIRMPVESSEVVLIHTGYATETVVKAKKERYVAMMEEWLKTHPEDIAIRYQLGLALHTMGRNHEAVQAFRGVLEGAVDSQKGDPACYYSAVLLGRALLDLNRLEESLHALKKAEAINPRPSFLKISLAEAYIYLDDPARAISYLEGSVDSNTKELSFFPIDFSQLEYGRLVLLGKAKLDTGSFDDAHDSLSKAMAIKPDRPEADKHYAEWLRRMGRYNDAIKQLQIAAEKDPKNFYYDYQIGDIFRNLGWLAKAGSHFKKALEMNNGHPAILINLAEIERDCGHFEASKDYFERLLLMPEKGEAIYLQYFLGLADAGNIQTLSTRMSTVEKKGYFLWLTWLVDLYNEQTETVKQALLKNHPLIKSDDEEEIANYLMVLADKAQEDGDLLLAELQLRTALFLTRGDAIAILVRLSRAQMMNRRLFQAITTMEAILTYSHDQNLIIQTLHQVAECYLLIGVKEAHQLCKERINQLEASAATTP